MKYQFKDNLFRELIVDNFAGGGGASTGIELALGQPVDIAINHDEMAIKMHEKNHPYTLHIKNDVFAVDPLEITGGRPVGLAWFSPDCTHFSKAKGGLPRKQEIRDLAWVVVKWAKSVKPRIIMLENVEEFKTWGPLDENGYPIKEQSGETFKEWLSQLKELGYEIEFKELVAADYGAPTIRKRLFIIARCDGKPIVFPQPTHSKDGKNGLKKWVGANTIIDFNIRGKSIFNRTKELAHNTMRRIARGIDRYVIKNPSPFIIEYHSETLDNEMRGQHLDKPLGTQGTANRFGLVTPLITKIGQTGFIDNRSSDIQEPLRTVVSKNEDLIVTPKLEPFIMVNNTDHPGTDIKSPKSTTTTANKDCLINPVIVPVGYGEAPGQAPRVQDLKQPLNTVVSHSTKHTLVNYIAREFTDAQASDINKPLPTITAVDHNRLVSCYIVEYYGNSQGGIDIKKPLHTQTALDRHALMTITLSNESEFGNWNLVRKMLNEHVGYSLKDNELLLLEIDGITYFISDIEMRMLEPKELYAAQGFPHDYNFTCDGEMTRTEQVKKVGNSVCPPLPFALVKANYEPAQIVPPIRSMLELNHYATFGKLPRVQSKDSQ